MQQSLEIVIFLVLRVFTSSFYNDAREKINVTSIDNNKTYRKNLVKLFATKYWRMDQAKFVKYSISKIGNDMVYFNRPYYLKFFVFQFGCLPKILLGPLLNILSHFIYHKTELKFERFNLTFTKESYTATLILISRTKLLILSFVIWHGLLRNLDYRAIY